MKHLYWIIPAVLAGRTGPDEEPWNLEELSDGGIGCIVSLNDDPLDSSKVMECGIVHETMHLPEGRIRSNDMRRVFRRAARGFVKLVDKQRAKGRAVVVHCLWGNDRTGIMLAAYLIARQGMSPEEAIRAIRRHRPDALRLPGYEETVQSLAR